MVVRTTPRLATLGPRLRNAVLILFALFVAHDAVYLAQFGLGARFATAMSQGGHDLYWAPVSLAIGVGVALIFLVAVALMARLELRAVGTTGDMWDGPSYLHELASTWLRLFPTVAVLFAIQENVEHFLVDGHLVGLWALAGAAGSVVLPVLAATTFVLASLGSLVRWRIRVLEARIASSRRATYPRPTASRRPKGWADVGAVVAHRWILDRRDAGRAPPALLRRTIGATV